MGATQSSIKPHILRTSKGNLKGLEYTSTETGKPVCYRYTKIPYARPPVGDLRWRRPQPLPKNHSFTTSGEAGDYTKFGPICPQPAYGHVAAVLPNSSATPRIANVQDEDCLYLNVWIPAGKPPVGGWPVQFQIHGGWLQVGNASQSNDHDPFDLLLHATPRVIVVPTYRLNLFGFLAGADLASATPASAPGNFGLWDQRAALEWTHSNIALFGGNPDNITVGGLSAGAHSTFLQLYYDTHLPPSHRIIKRIYLWSNAIAIQPNPATSTILTEQFDALCSANFISPLLPASTKVQKLRQIPSSALVSSISKLDYHTFRACTDDSFIPSTFLASLHSGSFTTKLAEHNISILVGDLCDEYRLYSLVNPPTTHSDLLVQLTNYYPSHVVEAILNSGLYPTISPDSTDKQAITNTFSRVVADGQVHASIRGLVHLLLHPPQKPGVKALPASNLFRYRIHFLAKSFSEWIQPELGVCHGADMPLWWFSGNRAGFTDEERQKVLKFLEPFGRFLYGEGNIGWGGRGEENEVRLLDEHGNVQEGAKDDEWERCIKVAEVMWDAQKGKVKHEIGESKL